MKLPSFIDVDGDFDARVSARRLYLTEPLSAGMTHIVPGKTKIGNPRDPDTRNPPPDDPNSPIPAPDP
jgi:hypothetical protein